MITTYLAIGKFSAIITTVSPGFQISNEERAL
jgi:hypothetical protein